jgi:hypothetical protein
MRNVRILAATTLVGMLLGDGARAAEPPQEACAAVAEPWHHARNLRAASDRPGLEGVRFAPGEAVLFELRPDGEVAYLTLPRGEGEAASFGGLAAFSIERAGAYRVGLSEPVWVDVAQDGKPAETVRFGPGPACSGIRKAVVFDLETGEHVLELSGGTENTVGVLIEPFAEQGD